MVDVRAVRGAELGSDHYLVLLKIELKVGRRGLPVNRRGRQQIKIDNMKEVEVRREYQERLGELYEVHKVKRYWTEGNVELAWKEMKELCRQLRIYVE